ncbi:hypothetical protein Sjap_020488 [Stephania japonica]|uniref:Pentatricopeptide repeat-containing protein n=1 Tax=Stephania japonica TaxID=461633 RepID=A0AAP0F1H5_9MAGN
MEFGAPHIIHRYNIGESMLKSHGRYAYRTFVLLSKTGPLVNWDEACGTLIRHGLCHSSTFFIVPSKIINCCRLVVTQTFSDEMKSTDQFSNQNISSVGNDPVASEERCVAYIRSICRSSDAAKFLQDLHNRQILLSPKAYNEILLMAGERNNFELLFQIFKDLLASGNSPSPAFFCTLARAFSDTTDSGHLLKFVGDASELIFPRSAAIINRVISGFREVGQVDKSLMIFDHMKNLKCKPDVVTYNIILDILGKAGRVDEMVREFTFMREANVIPDMISYNTLINSLRRMGRLDLCLVFWREMDERGFTPDLRTYTALIESFGRSGRVEEALDFFNDMKRKRVRPSIYVYRALITSLKKVGKFDLSNSLLQEMNSCITTLISSKDFKRKKK